MSKYEPLRVFLEGQDVAELPMTFEEIEKLIGASLPPAASRHRAWWSNNPDNSVVTRAWRGAGYKAFRVDMKGKTLVFRKDSDRSEEKARPQSALLERIWARLGGTVFIPPGVDITEPTGEIWDAETE